MDPNTQELVMGAAGASGGPKVYVEDVFSTYLYTGNGSTQTITNGIDLSGKGGLVWIKNRVDAYDHRLFDTTRGATKLLESSTTSAETTESTSLTSFTATGFSLDSALKSNRNGSSHVSWTFRKAAKFFDVVTYTGNGSNRTIAHSLGSVPGCIIVKKLDSTGGDESWAVYHRSTNATNELRLNSTLAAFASATAWNNTEPTSSVFSVGTGGRVNTNGSTYVAYLFAHDAGGFGDSGNDNVISCGSFTTDGSGNATVNLGWEPQWAMIKRTSTPLGLFADDWNIIDNMRGLTVNNAAYLAANSAAAEGSPTTAWSITNTGFKFAFGGDASATYIYIAIRRGPMKTPTAGTDVFGAYTFTSPQTFTLPTGWAPDLVTRLQRNVDDSFARLFGTRLQGKNVYLTTNSTAAENTSNTVFTFDKTAGQASAEYGGSGVNLLSYGFRRAPGFFDVVAYTGTGSARIVSHNLGVVPEFCIVKRRNSAAFWPTWSSVFTSYQYVALNETSAKYDDGSSNQTFSFTSSDWSIGTTFASVNASGGTYIAYLFATCPGVSKVGSYTGSGTTKQIDCGFTNGARFVLIKRTDSTGDWYVWDTARGIVSANDPYLLLNSTAAEVTNTDYIDPLSSGFEISSTAPAAINANGGSYIFLAIA